MKKTTRTKTSGNKNSVGNTKITFTIDVQDIVDAFDNPQILPMLVMLHQVFSEHIENLSRRTNQVRKKKVRKKA